MQVSNETSFSVANSHSAPRIDTSKFRRKFVNVRSQFPANAVTHNKLTIGSSERGDPQSRAEDFLEEITRVNTGAVGPNNIRVTFHTDPRSGDAIISIVSNETGEVVREIPPSEYRRLSDKIDQLSGLRFDKRI